MALSIELVIIALVTFALGAALAWIVSGRQKQQWQNDNQRLQFELQQQAQRHEFQQQQLGESEQNLAQQKQSNTELQQQLEQAKQQCDELKLLQAKHQEQIPHLQDKLDELQSELQDAERIKEDNLGLQKELEAIGARREEEQKAHEEKLKLLNDAESRLQTQFENLANKIFESKSDKFVETNKEGMNALLGPLKEQIEGFRRQVGEQYAKEGQERASLKTEITNLQQLNKQITEEAAALTKALKGDNKQQGNWGELVLERILTESGLREGHEYETQGQFKSEEGKAYQPDVIVHLPQEKDVIIDSKVSLSAYEQYFNSDDEAQRERFLKEHILSLRTHIKELGKKEYQGLEGIRTLDYVLMFVPIEAAFLLAVDEAPDLVKLALDNNIMLVSPTNLLVALRTINNIWQYEYQNQNAQLIAKKAADLYDKFHGFITDMEKLGDNLATVQKRYQEASSKLYTGRGNLVKRIEDFRKLGVQTSKKLDDKILIKATIEE